MNVSRKQWQQRLLSKSRGLRLSREQRGTMPVWPLGLEMEGHCGATSLKAPWQGNCLRDDRGVLALPPSAFQDWSTLASHCADACAKCKRCYYISFSVRFQDCSFYHKCSHKELNLDPVGFTSSRFDPDAWIPRAQPQFASISMNVSRQYWQQRRDKTAAKAAERMAAAQRWQRTRSQWKRLDKPPP
eukprot:CAMPEP_0206161116 /NCGR_PEP_ID=MMETSP1474-20131121/7382_1 /ASSEMBLY_ACC=CAM_ASM_001110 /TAXON_ID=97495 /ORGANISM="Imantonia sp., Strain RCC918" /LENGTH=186 /DNA_ID=CAMNT_0053562835 /DNA_START=13 /DNA_END=570 /DNA_ORIENTATION=-